MIGRDVVSCNTKEFLVDFQMGIRSNERTLQRLPVPFAMATPIDDLICSSRSSLYIGRLDVNLTIGLYIRVLVLNLKHTVSH
jgi:hypothetical protein